MGDLMPRKAMLLLLVIVGLFVVMYGFYWKETDDLSSKKSPSLRGVSNQIKEYKIDQPERDFLNEQINQMTIEEKIGQLIFTGIRDTVMTEETETLITQYQVGGIILFAHNLEAIDQSVQLLNQLKRENEENKLPLFLGVDQEGGRVERLPGIIGLPTNGAIGIRNSGSFSFEIGETLGKQLNAFGFNLNFAPVLDVNSNPDNPVIGDRSFGDSPELVSKLGIQTIEGMKAEQIIPVVKHFPGHGDTDVDSHFELPSVDKSLEELQKLEFIPFKEAIDAGIEMVMVAHMLLPQIDNEFPASLSEKVITGILRKQLNFDGVVITDDLTMQAISDHYDLGQAAVESVKAGTDIILMAHDYDGVISVYEKLRAAVENGEISEERIDESVERIIQLKWKYELADQQNNDFNPEELNEWIGEVLSE